MARKGIANPDGGSGYEGKRTAVRVYPAQDIGQILSTKKVSGRSGSLRPYPF